MGGFLISAECPEMPYRKKRTYGFSRPWALRRGYSNRPLGINDHYVHSPCISASNATVRPETSRLDQPNNARVQSCRGHPKETAIKLQTLAILDFP